MYCKICGNSLKESALKCDVCGAPIQSEQGVGTAEEIVYNFDKSLPEKNYNSSGEKDSGSLKSNSDMDYKPKFKPEFKPEIKKEADTPVKEINYVWTPDDAEDFGFVSRPKASGSEFNNTDYQNAKVSDDEFSWNVHDFGKQAVPAKPVAPEEFIWDTKTEKFELPKGLAPEEKALDHEIDKFFTFSQKSEEFQKLLDQEYEKISKISTYPKNDTITEPKGQMVLKDETQPKETVKVSDRDIVAAEILSKATVAQVIKADSATLVAPFIAADSATIVAPFIAADSAATVGSAILQKPPVVQMAAARDEFFPPLSKNPDSKMNSFDTSNNNKINAHKFDTIQAGKLASFKDSNEEGGQKNSRISADDEDEDDDRQGWGIGKTLIAIVIVIIILEFAMLGIKYFLPNSEAAVIINDFQKNISEDIRNLFNSTTGPETEEPIDTEEPPVTDPEPEPEPEPPAVIPDPTPMADKDALVASQLFANSNIKQVKANDTFAYNDKISYKTTDINESKPLGNNILFTSAAGTTTYVDTSIVAAVIAFDSKWIDYVNTGDKAILDLVKMDSQAYKNVVNFNEVGKIQEEFLLLEIGEIRVGEKSYYLWTHERIQVVDGGKTTTKDYKWIYQLEPVDNVMKIVNYYRY